MSTHPISLTRTRAGIEQQPSEEVFDTVRSLEEDDLVVVNHDTRTHRVSGIVRPDLDEADHREDRLLVRLEHPPTDEELALDLEVFPDREILSLNVLESKRLRIQNGAYAVTDLEVLQTEIPFVVITRGGRSNKYHRPDPSAAAEGEAEPLCRRLTRDDASFRLTSLSKLRHRFEPCINCFRFEDWQELPELECPECGRLVGKGVLSGEHVGDLEQVHIRCSSPQCDYEGPVDLPEGL